MSSILRNNAARQVQRGVGEAQLRGGGDGRTLPSGYRATKVKAKVRYSHDPARELMPAAEFLGSEPDFAAILEDFGDSPFNPARRKVLGKLMGVFAMDYQGARSQERAFLRRLLMARNAREGYVANRALHLVGAENPIRRTLALGVAESRWHKGPLDGFLGAVQARVAATTFMLLGPESRESVTNLLTRAGRGDGKALPGADPVVERALILKAVGARRHRLGPLAKDGPKALDEVVGFADAIRGCWRTILARQTSLLSGEPSEQAKCVQDASGAWRAVLIARGHQDPVFAWSEHGVKAQRGPSSDGECADIYLSFPELERHPLVHRPRLHQALGEIRNRLRLNLSSSLILPEWEAFSDYLTGLELRPTRLQYAKRGWVKLKAALFDLPDEELVKGIREDAQGIYKFDAARSFGLLLSPFTGAVYVRRLFGDLLTAGLDPSYYIDLSLRQGLKVPVLVKKARSTLYQAWLALDVQGVAEERQLVLERPATQRIETLSHRALSSPSLPEAFGNRSRADTYLAPAALDLLAPPFGIAWPKLGLEDLL
jgi:hypothetical protein